MWREISRRCFKRLSPALRAKTYFVVCYQESYQGSCSNSPQKRRFWVLKVVFAEVRALRFSLRFAAGLDFNCDPYKRPLILIRYITLTYALYSPYIPKMPLNTPQRTPKVPYQVPSFRSLNPTFFEPSPVCCCFDAFQRS